MENNILIIEDDKDISEMLGSYLKNEGFSIEVANDGKEGIEKFKSEEFTLVILDLMLPHINGMDVLKTIREESQIPVLILSAKGTDVDKAIGLGLGADDYISKPFSMIEITARIKASIRRATMYSKTEVSKKCKYELGDLVVDVDNFSVIKLGKELKLTQKEFSILKLFVTNPKRVFTKSQVYEIVWENDYFGNENVINVHMRRLREKIEDMPSKPLYILTLWGIGYKLGDFN